MANCSEWLFKAINLNAIYNTTSILVRQLIFTNAIAACTTVDSVCIHIRRISETTLLFQMNDSRWWTTGNMIDLCWHCSYHKPHKITIQEQEIIYSVSSSIYMKYIQIYVNKLSLWTANLSSLNDGQDIKHHTLMQWIWLHLMSIVSCKFLFFIIFMLTRCGCSSTYKKKNNTNWN